MLKQSSYCGKTDWMNIKEICGIRNESRMDVKCLEQNFLVIIINMGKPYALVRSTKL
jgi:hypothetical protein